MTKRAGVIAAVAGSALLLAGLLFTTPDPASELAAASGPIPQCFGEQATHVLVAEDADYTAWAEQGVIVVQAEADALIMGTPGHDVLVSFVSTETGGIVSGPKWQHPPSEGGPIDGDSICAFTDSYQTIYASKWSDKIYTQGGASYVYMAGCEREGEGSPGNRACDVYIDAGPPGENIKQYNGQEFVDSFGRDLIFGYTVPAGRVQRITQQETGGGWAHIYVGRGKGKVVVSAGDCNISTRQGFVIPCSGDGAQIGDHIHFCKSLKGIESTGVEFFGPDFGGDINNPCAVQAGS